MTTFTKTFTTLEDRQRVLAEILNRGPASPGTTLIALVDRVTLTVLEVRRMPTPAPVLGPDRCFEHGPIRRLADALCDLAREIVPVPARTGEPRRTPPGELVTVVCRGGAAVISPVETQFFYAWRHSDHGTHASSQEVFAVTDAGWVSLRGAWSGREPSLPVGKIPAAPDAEQVVRSAESILVEASSMVLGPAPRECLLCYVQRMLRQFGCDGRLRFARHFRDARAPRATALEERLGRVGGYCDCEIFLNGYDLRHEYWVPDEAIPGSDPLGAEEATRWPDPLPPCIGVRAGSTQPCGLWWRPGRGAWW